jgi:hypothetical protein
VSERIERELFPLTPDLCAVNSVPDPVVAGHETQAGRRNTACAHDSSVYPV